MDTSWLGRKYCILQEQADAAAMRARAESSLNEMQGRYLGAQTAKATGLRLGGSHRQHARPDGPDNGADRPDG